MAKSPKSKPAKSVKTDTKFVLRSTPKLLDIGLVDTAPWNPKEVGTEDQLAKLRESIKADQSAGVLVVRRKPDGRYESLDGNHRLVVLRGLGVEQVPVLDYGEISDAEAALVNYRLNAEWFETDFKQSVQLIKTAMESLSIDADELSKIAPMTAEEIRAIQQSAAFDWDTLKKPDDATEPAKTVQLPLNEKYTKYFDLWQKLAAQIFGVDQKTDAVEWLLRLGVVKASEYLDTPPAENRKAIKAASVALSKRESTER